MLLLVLQIHVPLLLSQVHLPDRCQSLQQILDLFMREPSEDFCKSWVPKNWCFWTVVLEKTLESPLACKEIQPVHSKGDESWVFFGRNDAKAETPVLWPPHVKSWLTGKDWYWEGLWAGGEGTTEDEMAGWYHWLDGRESEWTPGVDDGQGGLACCNSWGHKESDTTEQLKWRHFCFLLHIIF